MGTGRPARIASAIGMLAIFASIKHGLRYHRNWSHRFTGAWLRDLGVYRLSGRVRNGTAHALR